MKLDDDDFSLFGMPQRQTQDRAAIDASWKALQAQVHPDRFAAQGAAAQRLSAQWAMRVNEAHQRLRDPLKRAAYLCELRGVPLQIHENTRMPTAFLMEQMAWREALDDASGLPALEALEQEVQKSKGYIARAEGQAQALQSTQDSGLLASLEN